MEKQFSKNAYTCDTCNKRIVSVNLHEGVTPFLIGCRANWPGHCMGTAQSEFYGIDQTLPAEWGWYRPDEAEMAGLDPATKQHVERGGLLLRKLDATEREAHGGQHVRRA